MYQFIDEIDDQPYMRGDFVFKKLIQAYKYLYSEEYERMSSKQRIFDSIEHLKHEYNLNVEIPKDIPEDCNVICYNTATGSPYLYKEEGELLYYFAFNKTWCLTALETLEGEVEWDKDNLEKPCVYLRLATKDNSDVFTPERLLGLETTEGFITSVFNS